MEVWTLFSRAPEISITILISMQAQWKWLPLFMRPECKLPFPFTRRVKLAQPIHFHASSKINAYFWISFQKFFAYFSDFFSKFIYFSFYFLCKCIIELLQQMVVGYYFFYNRLSISRCGVIFICLPKKDQKSCPARHPFHSGFNFSEK